MSHVFVDATVKGRRRRKVRFMVDTGATYSLISRALARETGLVNSGVRETVRLANGRRVRVPVYAGLVRIDGREASTIFWVGPCDEPLLGVETLESLGLAVDPSRGRLKPTRPYASRLGGFGRR